MFEIWRQLIVYGDSEFQRKYWELAEQYYRDAESLSRSWLENDPTFDKSLNGWVTSCHKLSALYQAQGLSELAQSYMVKPHYHLLSLAADEYGKVNEAVVKMTPITFQALVEFQRLYLEGVKSLDLQKS